MRTLHLGLKVTDLERSLAFYSTLGYVVIGRVPDTELGSLAMLKLPDDEFVSLELVHDPAAGTVDPRGFSHLVIQVETLHDTISRLARAGITADAPTSPDASEQFLTSRLSDPDGYRIELVQWPPDHPAGMSREDF